MPDGAAGHVFAPACPAVEALCSRWPYRLHQPEDCPHGWQPGLDMSCHVMSCHVVALMPWGVPARRFTCHSSKGSLCPFYVFGKEIVFLGPMQGRRWRTDLVLETHLDSDEEHSRMTHLADAVLSCAVSILGALWVRVSFPAKEIFTCFIKVLAPLWALKGPCVQSREDRRWADALTSHWPWGQQMDPRELTLQRFITRVGPWGFSGLLCASETSVPLIRGQDGSGKGRRWGV